MERPLIELKSIFVCSLFEWCTVIRGLSCNSLVEFMEFFIVILGKVFF